MTKETASRATEDEKNEKLSNSTHFFVLATREGVMSTQEYATYNIFNETP